MRLIRLLYYYFIPMENKLEQLLNSLIEKGWKPFGEDIKQIVKNRLFLWYVSKTPVPLSTLECKFSWVLRELVSKESWLWQFVCENGMIKEQYKHERILDPTFWEWWADCKRQEHDWKYWYRLIESALKDESELESFILDNIKV